MAFSAVVICGGRITGIEGVLRLRRLAGDQVDVILLPLQPIVWSTDRWPYWSR